MIKKKVLFTNIFFAVFSVCLFASPRGAQKLLPPGHFVYDALSAIQIECGVVHFSDNAPLSIQELNTYLEEIDYEKLSTAGKNQYECIKSFCAQKNFSMDAGILSLGIEPVATLEGQWKSSENIDWVYNRYKRNPLLDIPVTLGVGDFIFIEADIPLSQSRTFMQKHDNYINVPFSEGAFDINFPHTTYLSTGKKFTDDVGFNFRIGMGSQSFGRSSTGSVILSEYLTDTPYAALSIFSKYVHYSCNITELNTNRYLYMHTLELRFFKKFTFSMFEGALPYGPLDLRFLNPFTVFHGYTAWHEYQSNGSDQASYMGLKINYTPTKFIRLYSIFSMNQIQTPFEIENYPDVLVPNAMGVQLGLESFYPIKDGYLHFCLEGYYANPYLYINEDPNWSLVRTYKENSDSSGKFYEWVGSPFGPDTIAGKLNVGYEIPNKWSLDFAYLFLARGELSVTSGSKSIFGKCGWGGYNFSTQNSNLAENWVYPTEKNKYRNGNKWSCPTGVPEYVNGITLQGTYSPLPYLTFIVQPAYTMIFNFNHEKGNFAQGFECAFAVKCFLTRI